MAKGRHRLRQRLRDVAAMAAFASAALSGALPAWVVATFGACWLLSLAGKRPFAARPALSAALLLVAALVLFGLAWRGVLDLLVAAGTFATLVTSQRMLAAPTRETDQQVLLASVLLLAGGAALSGEIWYAACLFLFGLSGSLALGLGIIEGPVETESWLPVRPVLAQLSLGMVFAIAGAIVFFVAFPRMSWNIASRRTGPGLLGGTAGMSDTVRLGGGGSIKTNARAVMRASLSPDPGVEQLERYWVGRVFDTFEGQEWRGHGTEGRLTARVKVGAMAWRETITQRIELLPAYESRTLVALETPITFDEAVGLTTSGSGPAMLAQLEGEEVHVATPANGYRYVAVSSEAAGPGPIEPIDRQRYLQLPRNLDPRVKALAERLKGSATTPKAIAVRLEEELRRRNAYTLELPGDVADPLADFLFVRKEGHCEHFASALTVMLRTLGIPARVAAGFFGGERAGGRYVLRAGDAHAWTQAWFEDEGWVRFDATPSDGRRRQTGSVLASLVSFYERLEEAWRRRVLDYSLIDQVNAVRTLVRPPPEARGTPKLSGLPSARSLGLGLFLAVATFLTVRRLGRAGPPRPHPAAGFLEAIERRLSDLGVHRLDGEPLEELSARLRTSQHPLAAPVSLAARRYLEARFGGRPLVPGEAPRLLAALARPPKSAPAAEPGAHF